MGLAESFLSRPVEEKFSEDDSNGKMCYGASSMQGWRMRQEDAHNCILDFDDDTSLFAVYDGHGGAEVAAYAAEEFPNCLRNIEEYKKGLFTEALINAFLKFDDSVKTPEVMKRLLQLVVEPKNEDEDDGDQAGGSSSGGCCRRKDDDESLRNEAEAGTCQAGGSSSGGCSSSKVCDDDDYEDFESLRNEAKKPLEEVMATYMNKKLDKILKKLVGTPVNLSCTESKSGSASASGSSSNNGQSFGETSPGGSGAVVEQNSSQSNQTSSNDTPTNNAEIESDNVENTKNGSGDHEKSESTNDTENSKRCQQDSSTETLPKRISKEPSSILGDQPGTSPTKKKLSSLNLKDIDTVKSFITNDEIGESDDDDSEDESFQPSTNDLIHDEDDDDDDDEEVDENEEDDEDLSDEDEDEDEELSDEDESGEDDEQDDSLVDWHLSSDEMKRKPGYYSGCTAVVALIRGNDLYVANAGDSRCILSVNGVAVDMTEDHDPKNAGERRRIIEAGGKVHDGRVQGDLNLSRAFGDHKYKLNANLSNREQMITALPDVKTAKIGPDTDFLVLICDGIWNCMTNQELVDFIRPKFEKKQKLSSICEELFSKCLSPSYLADGGNDNMTCVIVDIHPNRVSSTESSNSDDVKKAVKTIPVEIEAANAVASIVEENEPASTESCGTDVTVADEHKKVVEKESLKRKLSDEEISSKKLITEKDLSVNSHENS